MILVDRNANYFLNRKKQN